MAEKTSSLCSHTVAANHLRFANKDALEEIYRIMFPGGAFGMILVRHIQEFCMKGAMLTPECAQTYKLFVLDNREFAVNLADELKTIR